MNEANGIVKYRVERYDGLVWGPLFGRHNGVLYQGPYDSYVKAAKHAADRADLGEVHLYRVVREDTGEVVTQEYRPTIPAPVVKKLPTDDAARKGLPVFRGPLMYFPDAILAVAAVCKAGNDQHNPGQPLHWAREKSTEQMDTALRHMMDHGLGNTKDVDGTFHLAKTAWRILAELQLTIEREGSQ